MWPWAVCESEQNTIACAPICSASALRPCGVERSVTAWLEANVPSKIAAPRSSTSWASSSLDGLVGVAHVAEGHLGAGAGEQRAERDRVVLVGGAVVGNDDLGHFCSSVSEGLGQVFGSA